MSNRQNLEQLLQNNSYPGRGIVIGKHADGQHAVIAYFIMGRSENSRNRVFVEDGEGIRTQAFDPAKLTDPSLIIYHPVRVFRSLESGTGDGPIAFIRSGEHPPDVQGAGSAPMRGYSDGVVTVVTNGDQTDTVYEAFQQGRTFEEALRTRTFEPDPPNFTPRISGALEGFRYQLSILKSANGNPDSVQRFFYEYMEPVAGEGHFIHTYRCDGNPIPSFEGEPACVGIDGGIDAFTDAVWNALNPDNKVSLFVRYIDVEAGTCETRIVNQNQ